MNHILPQSVISSIQQSYLHGVTAAEKGYRYAQEDEDVVTGALGQALLSEDQSVVVDNTVYVWRTTYQKFRGRGKNAAEKLLGADGIIQIEVRDGQQQVVVARKGLLFQAKNNWQGRDLKLKSQSGLLSFPYKIPVGIVINYSPRGYYAVPAETVYDADGDRGKIGDELFRPLSIALAEDFLYCRLGIEDVYYDPASKTLFLPKWLMPKKNMSYRHVITTTVVRVILK